MKVRFAGFGGQGIVLCGVIYGRAAMLDGKKSMQTQSYGSASRGGLTRSDVCIQETGIHDLIYDRFDQLVAMSQQSYDAFHGLLVPEGLLFYESDLVKLDRDFGGRAFGIQATEIAHEVFGRKIMANMVMMGFVNRIAPVVSPESLAATIRDSVPPGTEKKNEAALAEGARLGALAREAVR